MFESIFGSLIATLIVKFSTELRQKFSERMEKETNPLRKAELKDDIDFLNNLSKDAEQKLISKEKIKALSEPLDKIIAISHIKGVLERSAGMINKNNSLTVKDMQEIQYFLAQDSVMESIEIMSKPLKSLDEAKGKNINQSVDNINNMIFDITKYFKIIEQSAGPDIIFESLNRCLKLEYELKQLVEMLIKNV